MMRSLTKEPLPADGLPRQPTPPPAGTPSTAPASGGHATWSGTHPVNIRVTLPTPWGRCFVLLLAGPERRSPTRLQAERARHPLATLGNVMVMLLFGSVVGLAGVAAIQFAAALLLGQPETMSP